jgi:DNA mismatch repair ATPase MutS
MFINLYRRGDFAFCYGSQAHTVSPVLNLVVTKDKLGVSVVGIPLHCLDAWTSILENAGYKVNYNNQ